MKYIWIALTILCIPIRWADIFVSGYLAKLSD
jgi:hypothetical protein